jgi:PTS system nitrogen regulatory IIA component
VRLVIAMLVPEHATEAHLEILSELAQMFSDRELRERLLAADDIAAAHRLLTEWSAYAPSEHPATL